MRILLTVDGSIYTKKAVKYLASHLEFFKEMPELHLLHVKAPIPAGLAVHRARALLGNDAVDSYYKEESEKALAVAEKALSKKDIPFTSSYKVGEITDEIRKYASKNKIDLIVMGSHGHGALAGAIMGSVATKIMASTDIPVLIVR
ncbi:Putative Universal stress protein UspA [Herminiimonas arsenicoxydans]|uniref:Universal stress protein UspA n=1 Tax=Herminiimonas arsenicoxydans TaxID=204773 RepID=A4G594_HERAR|nr:Putative Universal stress protein UspA [Herminiimonas arsenicoxydans]